MKSVRGGHKADRYCPHKARQSNNVMNFALCRAELTDAVQQRFNDERRFPGGFQALSRDELRHVPGCGPSAGR